MNTSSYWRDLPPPQYIYSNMRFKAVVLEPPDLEPGSWIGAGKAMIDHESGKFLLTARPRKADAKARGFAANIYHSTDGETFAMLMSLSKDEVTEKSGVTIASIEGTQLLKNPLTGKWHFYLSVDTTAEFVWGGIFWETLLLVADDLNGPWESAGMVIRPDRTYDSCQARDASIDIVDDQWIGLCKAVDHEYKTKLQLVTSDDGIRWQKHGLMTVDGTVMDSFFVSGSLFPAGTNPVCLGVTSTASTRPATSGEGQVFADRWKVAHGKGERHFAAYQIDISEMNLKTIFSAPWEAGSEYEHKEYPILGYSSAIYDPFKSRVLLYVEAIGPESKHVGMNETVERVLLYECRF